MGRLPTIRFGSTETCLQVMGTPNRALDEGGMMEAFRRGWERPEGGPPAFWVGRPHPPFTEVGVGCLMYGIWYGSHGDVFFAVVTYSIDSFIHPFILYSRVVCEQVMVVRGVDPADAGSFLKWCEEGERGFLVTRGRNLMGGYVQGEEATRK